MQSIRDREFIAFDTETTGIFPTSDGLVEIAAVRFTLAGGPVGSFQTLINPEQIIPRSASAVHGITNKMVAGAPSTESALLGFFQFSENALFVAHNARFDVDFVAIHARRLGLSLPNALVFDTLKLARRLRPGLPSYKLESLTKEFGASATEFHRALADSYSCMNVFRSLCDPATTEINSFRELCEAHGTILEFDKVVRDLTDPAPTYRPLAEAMHLQAIVRFDYEGSVSPREVTPLALYEKGKLQYMEGYCHLDRSRKTYRLDRIEKILLHDGN